MKFRAQLLFKLALLLTCFGSLPEGDNGLWAGIYSSIAGQVFAADGVSELSNVDVFVAAYSEASGEIEDLVGFGRTDSNGIYLIDGLEPGTHKVLFEGKLELDLAGGAYGVSLLEPKGTTIRLNIGEAIEGIDFRMRRLSSIRGCVRSGNTGEPLESVAVSIINRGSGAGSDGSTVLTTYTDADGRFVANSLRTGIYSVALEDSLDRGHLYSNFGSNLKSDSLSEESYTGILLGEGQHIGDVDGELWLGASISGKVTLPDGTPSDAYEVILLRLQNENQGFEPFYGELAEDLPTGEFKFINVRPGTYSLRFTDTDERYIHGYFGGKQSPSHATPILLESGDVIVNSDFQFQIGGSLSGTLYGLDGITPISGGYISLRQWSAAEESWKGVNLGRSILSDPSGRFDTGLLVPGDYRLSFIEATGPTQASTGTYAFSEEVAVISDQNVDGVDLLVELGGMIKGIVKTPDGVPVTNCTIRVHRISGEIECLHSHQAVTFYGTEAFHIAGLCEGLYRLVVEGGKIPDRHDLAFGTAVYPLTVDENNPAGIEVRTGEEVNVEIISLPREKYRKGHLRFDLVEDGPRVRGKILLDSRIISLVQFEGTSDLSKPDSWESESEIFWSLGRPMLFQVESDLSVNPKRFYRLNSSIPWP